MTEQHGRWLRRRGELAEGGWETVVDDRIEGWSHTGLRVARLGEGETIALDDTGVERLIVPLAGSFEVAHREDGGVETSTTLRGRRSVFDGPTDVLYLSAASTGSIRGLSSGESRVAVATSPTREVRPSRHLAADEVPVELRGAGSSSRQVHAIGGEEVLDAARLLVVEVITPAGNWSSYPPHKHDEEVPGHESALEEIYYFEAAPAHGAPASAQPQAAFGLFSAYSSPRGRLEIDAQVRTGDIALVPYGYHGPAVAAPGYDLYYLNVMAGPGPERRWLITDDPSHSWVRDSWSDEGADTRLPFGPSATATAEREAGR